MRKNLGPVQEKATPALPGLATETISLQQAAKILGVGWKPKRLAALGLKPVQEAVQMTPSGTLTFRAYDKSQVLAVKARIEAERLAAAAATRRAVDAAMKESGMGQTAGPPPINPQPSTIPPTDPTPRQQFAVLCEIRDFLKALTRKTA